MHGRQTARKTRAWRPLSIQRKPMAGGAVSAAGPWSKKQRAVGISLVTAAHSSAMSVVPSGGRAAAPRPTKRKDKLCFNNNESLHTKKMQKSAEQ